MKKASILMFVAALFLVVTNSCKEDDSFDPNATGDLLVSFNKVDASNLKSEAKPSKVLISLENESQEKIFINEEIQLYKFGESYISTVIPLTVGVYTLSEFMVMDDNNNVLYATPKEGSNKEYLVSDPLNIDYTISKDEVKTIAPEVISTKNNTPEDFGYSTFGFNIVETIDFLTAIFVYDKYSESLELTSAEILIESEDSSIYNGNLSTNTNLITVSADYQEYLITISKPGYLDFSTTLSKDSLINCFNTPLTVILEEGNRIVLRPGEEGKDATVSSIIPDTNKGDFENLHLYSWTQSGILNVVRSFVEFDLSQIPENSVIEGAFISLYYSSDPNYGEHSGENGFVIERITSSWDESTVTWNTQPTSTTENRILFDGSTSGTEDFINLEVTTLIQDIYSDMHNSYGLVLKLQDESAYRRLVFASSDNINETIRPKLEIYYSESK